MASSTLGDMDLWAVAAALRSATDLRRDAVSRSGLRQAIFERRVVVVRRGWYVEAATWEGWFAEARVAARAIATARSGFGGDVVASHTDALALHGLPLHRFTPRHAHVTGPRTDGSTGRDGVARHRGSIADGDVVEIGGIRTTSLVRTIADVIGRLPLLTAVAVTDTALRRSAWRGAGAPYDGEAAGQFCEEVRSCAALRSGAAGRVQAEWVLDFADGRAQLPGESTTRVLLHRLGFARPRLQVRIPLPDRGWYDIDFGLDDVGAWLEFDGVGKYTDPSLRGGRESSEVVLEEKHREDVIRGMTGRPVLRVGSAHIASAETLHRRLALFGVVPPLRRPAQLPAAPQHRSL